MKPEFVDNRNGNTLVVALCRACPNRRDLSMNKRCKVVTAHQSKLRQ